MFTMKRKSQFLTINSKITKVKIFSNILNEEKKEIDRISNDFQKEA